MCRRKDIISRITSNTRQEGSGCWIWQGADSGNGRGGGYPRMSLDGATVAVHRALWICFNGPIPPKKQLDHKCCNRMCVNPDHLELVTNKENARRRDARKKVEIC